MHRWLLSLLAIGLVPSAALAQPTNVRGWYAYGQVFIVWETDPLADPLTYDIYASVQREIDTTQMTLIGRLLRQEWEGQRLRNLSPGVTLRLPGPLPDTTYPLTSTEGAFAFTPHQSATLYFAVVKHGDTAVANPNRDQVTFGYDPVNEPVQPHAQFDDVTEGGYPYTAYVSWADGRPNPDDARPDYHVGGNEHRNGVPHVFVITHPLTPLPVTPYSAVFAMHGGEGAYQNFLPGRPERANLKLELADGIVITPNDNLYLRWGDAVTAETINMSTRWFGYAATLDPFSDAPRTDPPDEAIVVNYTARRIAWILDWVLSPNSGYNVDPTRVAMIGHSAGAAGTSTLTRQMPERFCAAVCHNPAIQDSDRKASPLHGQPSQNLATNLNDGSGQPIGIHAATRYLTTRLSAQRDFCFTHCFTGIRDDKNEASWNAVQRSRMDELNASRMGMPISWDEREHGIEKWDTDAADATDDPDHCDPWPDVAQWIAPLMSERHGAQYLVDAHRSDRSFPGFFNVDEDPLTAGRQPDPGPGDPCATNFDVWGTWGGYCDWETATIVDESDRWECTVFLRGLSPVSIDNSLAAEITSDLAPRKTQFFAPAAGTSMHWTATDVTSGLILQSGSSIAEADGVVAVTGLVVPRDPDRIRVAIFPCPGDIDGDGQVGLADLSQLLSNFAAASGATVAEGDLDNDGDVDLSDLARLLSNFGTMCA